MLSAGTELRCSCSSLRSQCSRDKGWWKKKDALFRKLATWEDGGLVSPKASPSCQLEGKGVYREKTGSLWAVQVGATRRVAQSALTVILTLVMQWCGQCHVDCFRHS